jgi:hypothetical protein
VFFSPYLSPSLNIYTVQPSTWFPSYGGLKDIFVCIAFLKVNSGSATWYTTHVSSKRFQQRWSGIRERHTCTVCIGHIKSKNFTWKHHFHSWTSVALNMCELNTMYAEQYSFHFHLKGHSHKKKFEIIP